MLFWPLSVSLPSCVKDVAVPPFTWNEKSVAILVPPLSLITTFLTMRVPVVCTSVNVQVVTRPDSMGTPETVAVESVYVVLRVVVPILQTTPVGSQPVGMLVSWIASVDWAVVVGTPSGSAWFVPLIVVVARVVLPCFVTNVNVGLVAPVPASFL